ncbi:ABC transporter permease [Candidatus Nitrospira inopinata]|jgi:phospholipid/cholesterol/gamma-HCH transport system permease protein|uniref:Putative ABC-type transport system, permease component n=1 Tax=Candidatus Nitrospira inopinata TaxID=1715989 RepID=A0A0S4KR31_9BACT|nr:MlaE family lipid ABC transporter permease subunit [Candidatus Nitrospira inopinata]CUQ65630.1 putative ABC-type transport system, permease component [Candidatus Nitrospira inopinata]
MPVEQQAIISVSDDVVQCRGAWTLSNLNDLERRIDRLGWPTASEVICDVGEVTAMDTGGALLLQRIESDLVRRGKAVSVQGLKPEFAELVRMVQAKARLNHASPAQQAGWEKPLVPSVKIGTDGVVRALAFLGETTVAIGRSLLRPRLIRWRAMLRVVEFDGVRALPITGLLTFLVGVVIAYQGAEQLRKFGTNIFIVDLVGISLLREIAPLIVAILIAGRSGSAYAAEIGTMKVTEELDAVRTLGISPINLLVLPRTFALVLTLPLLTVYADILGVFGGMLIASGQLNVSFAEFLDRFDEAVAVRHLLIGLAKAPFFAVIIALVGCYQGFQIRGGVDDVGRHTTISVVQSIFLVIVFDAICSVLTSWWDL